MGNIKKVNISLLKGQKNSFNNEKDNFNNSAYQTFNSSYLKNCSDSYVVTMKNNLEQLYLKIQNGYSNIYDWFNGYCNNYESLEEVLSQNRSVGNIEEPNIRNYVSSKLSLLEDFNYNTNTVNVSLASTSSVNFASATVIDEFSDLYSDFNNKKENVFSKVSSSLKILQEMTGAVINSAKNSITNGICSATNALNDKKNDLTNWYDNQAKPWIDEVSDSVLNTLKKSGATVGTFATSLGEGALRFGESIVDLSAIIHTITKTGGTLVVDGCQSVYGKVTGNEWNSLTKAMWDNTMAFVSKEHVAGWFDSFYENTSLGQYLKENSYNFETTRSIGNGIGYFAGVSLLPIAVLPEIDENILKRAGATIGTFATSLGEGVLHFGEAVVDLSAIIHTITNTGRTLVVDGCQAIYGKVTGNEWNSLTKAMWDNTKAFVAKEHVSGWFDSFYENTSPGQYLKEKSYGFETTRSFGDGIGYITGVTCLTIATFGVGGAAVSGTATGTGAAAGTAVGSGIAVTSSQTALVAGMAGVGKGTERAWNDGASTVQGLAYGTLNGVWEGIQYYAGAKIGAADGVGTKIASKILGTSSSNIAKQLVTSISRIILDGIDGGVEGFVQPLLNMSYKDGSYKELFDENGGWTYVATNAAIGSGFSAIGELIDLGKFISDNKKKTNNNDFKGKNSISNVDESPSKIDVSTKQTKVNSDIDISEIEKQIAIANYNAGKGRFSVINLNSLDDISLDTLKKVDDMADIKFNVNGKTYSYLQVKEYLEGKKFKEKNLKIIDLEKTITKELIPISKLEEILSKKDIYEKFINFDENQEFFGNYSKYDYEIALQDLIRTNKKNNYHFEFDKAIEDHISGISDLNINFNERFSTLMEKSTKNQQNLVSGIVETIPEDLDDISKARAIYLKLNQNVTYSDEYYALVKLEEIDKDVTLFERKAEIYNKKFDIENMDSNKIVCNNWSNIYKELLEKAGFDSSKIHIIGSDIVGNHKYVMVELNNNKILLADATNYIESMTDLAASKYGLTTHGFIIVDKSKYENLVSNNRASEVFRRLGTEENKTILERIDENIGYFDKEYIDEFNEVVSYYSNKQNVEIPLEQKVKTFVEIFDDKSMGSVESYPVMRKIAPKILGDGTEIKLKQLKSGVVVSIALGQNNGYLVKFNDENIKFTTDLDSFMKGILMKNE